MLCDNPAVVYETKNSKAQSSSLIYSTAVVYTLLMKVYSDSESELELSI